MLQSASPWQTWLVLLLVSCTGSEPSRAPRTAVKTASPVKTAPPVTSQPDSAPEAPTAPYSRSEWKHWIDADHDCQDTRTEVLIARSEVPVEFSDDRQCKIKRGRWTCPYTGAVVTDPSKLDIDHLVPLENAYRSGGFRWSREKKQAYANYLDDKDELVPVLASANRAKGSKGPADWLPQNQAFQCEYVREWQHVKHAWSLAEDEAERAAVTELLRDCPSDGGAKAP